MIGRWLWCCGWAMAAAGALLAARMVGDLSALALRPPPRAPELAAPARAPARAARAELTDGVHRLFGMEPLRGAAEGPRPSCADPDALPVKSALGFVLVAAVLPQPPSRALATLARPGTGERYLVAAGQRIAGALFLGLVPVRDRAEAGANASRLVALLCNGGAKEYVEPGAEGPAPPTAAPRRSEAADDVRAVGADRYELSRRTLDGVLGDLAARAGDARFVLALRDGRPYGLKALAVVPGSFVASLGIESGDVILRINGHEATAPERLLELFARLRESSQVAVELERAGRALRKQYAVTP